MIIEVAQVTLRITEDSDGNIRTVCDALISEKHGGNQEAFAVFEGDRVTPIFNQLHDSARYVELISYEKEHGHESNTD